MRVSDHRHVSVPNQTDNAGERRTELLRNNRVAERVHRREELEVVLEDRGHHGESVGEGAGVGGGRNEPVPDVNVEGVAESSEGGCREEDFQEDGGVEPVRGGKAGVEEPDPGGYQEAGVEGTEGCGSSCPGEVERFVGGEELGEEVAEIEEDEALGEGGEERAAGDELGVAGEEGGGGDREGGEGLGAAFFWLLG